MYNLRIIVLTALTCGFAMCFGSIAQAESAPDSLPSPQALLRTVLEREIALSQGRFHFVVNVMNADKEVVDTERFLFECGAAGAIRLSVARSQWEPILVSDGVRARVDWVRLNEDFLLPGVSEEDVNSYYVSDRVIFLDFLFPVAHDLGVVSRSRQRREDITIDSAMEWGTQAWNVSVGQEKNDEGRVRLNMEDHGPARAVRRGSIRDAAAVPVFAFSYLVDPVTGLPAEKFFSFRGEEPYVAAVYSGLQVVGGIPVPKQMAVRVGPEHVMGINLIPELSNVGVVPSTRFALQPTSSYSPWLWLGYAGIGGAVLLAVVVGLWVSVRIRSAKLVGGGDDAK